MFPWLIALGAFVLIALWFAAVYNGLIALRNQVKNAWSQIDIQLKRRYDLIPNLVNTVKGFMKHEKDIFEKIATARQAAMAAGASGNVAATAQAEGALAAAMRPLFALVENYPDLKSNQNVQSLMEELTSTENKVSFSRQLYNDVVTQFNTKLESFPTNVIAGMFQFKAAEFFQVENAVERQAVKVEF